MSQRETAILIDSCCDVPEEYRERYHMHMVPVKVIYQDREYDDRVDISPQEVYERLKDEVPRTSLPSEAAIAGAFDRIIADGCKAVLCITISSALSGTNNIIRLVAEGYRDRLDIHILDTKSIGLAAGMQAILAGQLVEEGTPAAEVYEILRNSARKSRVFFSLQTLEYLARGGRIGKVAAALGSLLHLKPIITCNEEGAYVTASKVRGRMQAIAEMINLTVAEAGKHAKVALAVVEGGAREELRGVVEELRRRLPAIGHIIQGDVSPALVVHTGPGLLGICVQALPC